MQEAAGQLPARQRVGKQPEREAHHHRHAGPAPDRRGDQHVAGHVARWRWAGREPHQHRRPHALAHQHQPGVRISPVQRCLLLPARRPPAPCRRASARGRAPCRSRAGPARRSPMPAATNSGAGISQALRLSLKPCSASTTTLGAPCGSQARYGSSAPSAMVKIPSVSGGARDACPGGITWTAQPASSRSRPPTASVPTGRRRGPSAFARRGRAKVDSTTGIAIIPRRSPP